MSQQITHAPHVGRSYRKGIGGNKIVVMGYSHWGSPDRDTFTTEAIRNVVAGDWPDIAFFNQIAGYFGREADFWDDVLFLNFVPSSIGDNKYAWASDEDHIRGLHRTLAVLEQYQPDMLFVFSRKAWTNLPATEEDSNEENGELILPDATFDRHHYRLKSGKIVQAFGLRHPERASKNMMERAVAASLKMQPNPERQG